MKKINSFLFALCLPLALQAQLGPEITSWIINTDGSTGYAGLETNVQQVQYSASYVYVSATCIPGYDIGPWVGNPNVPANQNFVFKITRTPVENTGTKTPTPLGHIGVWRNGVSIFNAKDAASYMNQNVWHQDAVVVEGSSFDACLGHPAPNGEYHHHLNPTCLYNDADNSAHSPVIGYAFDGFPIYGTFGFADTNGTGGIVQMKSSYKLRNITVRTHLADGSDVADGPAISATYPLGYYIEDWEYIPGLGDLDEYNGRFCITPDYPDGIYAYFVTIDSIGEPVYPYTLGPDYYGTVVAGNTGMGSGHNTPSEAVTTYSPEVGIENESGTGSVSIYPNPSSDYIQVNAPATLEYVYITDAGGRVLYTATPYTTQAYIDLQSFSPGIYFIQYQVAGATHTQKLLKQP